MAGGFIVTEAARRPLGVIGLGIMGSAMSYNLLRAGFPVIGYDVSEKARKDHGKAGGKAAKSAMAASPADYWLHWRHIQRKQRHPRRRHS